MIECILLIKYLKNLEIINWLLLQVVWPVQHTRKQIKLVELDLFIYVKQCT